MWVIRPCIHLEIREHPAAEKPAATEPPSEGEPAAVLARFFAAPAGDGFAALAVAATGAGSPSEGGSVAAGFSAADGAVADEPGSLASPLLVTWGSATGGPSGSLPLGFDSALGLLLGSIMVCVGRGSLSQEGRSAWSLP